MPCSTSLHLEWVFIMEEKRGEWKPPILLEGPQPVPLFLQRAARSDALPAFVVFRCLVCGCQGLVGGAVWAGWPLLTRMPGEFWSRATPNGCGEAEAGVSWALGQAGEEQRRLPRTWKGLVKVSVLAHTPFICSHSSPSVAASVNCAS